MAKSRLRTSLEETGLPGPFCAVEGLVLGRLWDQQKGSTAHSQTASSPLLRIVVTPVAPAGSATEWVWPHLGGGCLGARSTKVCSHPSPPPVPLPTLVHTWAMGTRYKGGLALGKPHHLPFGKEINMGNHLVGR